MARLRLLAVAALLLRAAGGQAAGALRVSAAPRALPDCALLVFRHVQKTGGSTLRNFFRAQEETGEWEFYSPQGDRHWPEVHNRMRMELLHKFWGALESPVTNFTQTPMRLILEWHAEAHLLPPWERALEVVSWLRYAASKRGCPVMLVTLLRQPVDLYASWYKYEGLRISRGQGLLAWVADNPNLQAATLMAGVSRPSALPLVTRLHTGRADRMAVWDPRDAAVLRTMLSGFDLIAPLEQFDEALALICHTMRFSACGYIKLNDGAQRDIWSMYSGNLSAADLHRMSTYGREWEPRNDKELVQAVERAASVDMRMYAQAMLSFAKKLRGVIGRDAFQAQLAALKADADRSGWRGKRPPQRYVWDVASQPHALALRLLPRVLYVNGTATAQVFSFVKKADAAASLIERDPCT